MASTRRIQAPITPASMRRCWRPRAPGSQRRAGARDGRGGATTARWRTSAPRCCAGWPDATRRSSRERTSWRARPRASAASGDERRDARPLRLVVADPRRFGTGELLLGEDALRSFLDARLGLEPFDAGFTGEHLHGLARGRTAPIKALLLDQRR